MGNKYGQVLQTLVTSGDQGIAVAGTDVFALGDGQLGLFDKKTGLAINGTGNYKEVFFAVGVHEGGSIADAVYSPTIQLGRVDSLSFRPATAGANQTSVLWNYCGLCDQEFHLKIQLENQKIFRDQGFVQFNKNYNFVTDCCGSCDAPSIPSGDCNKVTKGLVAAINADPDAIFTATPVAVTEAADGTYSSHSVIADIDAYIATQQAAEDSVPGSRACSGILIEANEDAIRTNAGLNRNYFYPRGYSFDIITGVGFACNNKQEVIVAPVYAEGVGADIEHREYINSTNNMGRGSAYFTSNTTNSDIEKTTRAVAATTYDQFFMEFSQKSSSAWLEYENEVGCVIAVPEADTTTLPALATILDALFASEGFEQISSDVAAADSTAANVEETEDKGTADDGIV